MRYRLYMDFIDDDILNNFNDYEIARLVGCTPGYIHHLRKGIRVASMKFYLDMKDKIERELEKKQSS